MSTLTMNGRLADFIHQKRLVHQICDCRTRLIMVIGSSDSGKTTLIECLANLLSKQQDVGMVDLDMGQSHIGLPTTIAWGMLRGGFKSWQSIEAEDFYFTGAFSPAGHLLPSLTGAKLITDKALGVCKKVIVDTTGLIHEPHGRVLKQFKIDLLRPDMILALEHSAELEHILRSFRTLTIPKIFRLPLPAEVDSKSIAKRTRYRIERFRSYLTGADIIEIPLNDIGIRYTRGPVRFRAMEMKNRIVSFRDQKNLDIALGIVERINVRERKLFVRTPMSQVKKFATVVVGETAVVL